MEMAFEGFKDAVLMALDDGYSDGMDPVVVEQKVREYIMGQDLYKERPDFMNAIISDIFLEWEGDHGIN